MKYLAEINGLFTEIDPKILNTNSFDVDFNGDMLVQFEEQEGKIIATNAMDGYGTNRRKEFELKELRIYKEIFYKLVKNG